MKFSIRDLMWVMILVSVLVAWALDHRRLAAGIDRIYRAAIRLEQQAGGPMKGFDIPRPEDI